MPDPVKMDVTENALQEDFPSSPCHGEDDARGGGGLGGGGGGGPTPPKTENNVTMDMDADPPVMTISEAVASASAAALHRLMESYTTQLSKLDTETQAVSKKAREATFKRTQQKTHASSTQRGSRCVRVRYSRQESCGKQWRHSSRSLRRRLTTP